MLRADLEPAFPSIFVLARRVHQMNRRGGEVHVGVPERVAYLEGQVTEVAKSIDALRTQMAASEERIDRRLVGLDGRLTAFEERMDRRFDSVDAKLSRQFTWLIGLFIMTMTAIVGTFLAR
jgi:hypothetical protein